MKKLARISALICVIAMIVSVFAVNAFAATDANGVSVDLSLDKEAYEAGEIATVTVTVTNNGAYEITDVSIKDVVAASGLNVIEEDDKVVSIAAGATETFIVKVQKPLVEQPSQSPAASEEPTQSPAASDEPSASPGETEAPGPGPVTGDNGMIFLYIILGIVAVAGVVFFAVKSGKKASKVIAILLCVALAAPLALGNITARADEGDLCVYEVEGGTTEAKVGDIVSLTVNLTGNPGIISTRFDMQYDNTKLKPVSYSIGSTLPRSGLTAVKGSNDGDFDDEEEVIRLDGTGASGAVDPEAVRFAFMYATRTSNITKTGAVITLNFEVIAEGSSEVRFHLVESLQWKDTTSAYHVVAEDAVATVATAASEEPTEEPSEEPSEDPTDPVDPTDPPVAAADLQYAINSKYEAPVGEVVELIVSLTNNPGILTSKVQVAYDASALKFVSYSALDEVFAKDKLVAIAGSNADDLDAGADVIRIDEGASKNPITIFHTAGASTTNMTATGGLVVLRFEVLKESKTNVTVTPVTSYNVDGELIEGAAGATGVVSTYSETEVVPEFPEVENPFEITEAIDVTYDAAYNVAITVSYSINYPVYTGVGYGVDDNGSYIKLYVDNNPGIISLRVKLSPPGLKLTSYADLGVLNGLTELKGSNEADLEAGAAIVKLDSYDGSVIVRFSDALAAENNTATGAVIKLYYEKTEGDAVVTVEGVEAFDHDGNEIVLDGCTAVIE